MDVMGFICGGHEAPLKAMNAGLLDKLQTANNDKAKLTTERDNLMNNTIPTLRAQLAAAIESSTNPETLQNLMDEVYSLQEDVATLTIQITAAEARINELTAQLITPDRAHTPEFGMLDSALKQRLIGYENKYAKAIITYPARFVGKDPTTGGLNMDIKPFADCGKNDSTIASWLANKRCRVQDALKDYPDKSYGEACEIAAVRVQARLPNPYEYDANRWGREEFWEYATEVFLGQQQLGLSFDCLDEDTPVITATGYKRIGDIVEGDEVFSYNFTEEKGEYKKVKNVWKKGKLPTKTLNFIGGYSIVCTDDHKLYFRQQWKNSKKSKYEVMRLSEHGGIEPHGRSCKNRVPYLIKQPYLVKDMPEFTEDLCFVVGYYIAEGWGAKNSKNTKFLCGYDIEPIVGILEEAGESFALYATNHGVPQMTLHMSPLLTPILDSCGRTAWEKKIPDALKSLPENKLAKLLEGYALGDGTKTMQSRVVYTTVSEQLKDDLIEIHNKLGKPCCSFFIKDSKGAANSPLWRVDCHERSYRLKNYGWRELSETTLYEIEDGDEREVVDIEVEGNHNFFLANGILVSNCDSWANTKHVLRRAAGIPDEMERISTGTTFSGEGHSTNSMYSPTLGYWVHLNSTSRCQDNDDIAQFARMGDGSEDRYNIRLPWFSFCARFCHYEMLTTEQAKEVARCRASTKPEHRLIHRATIKVLSKQKS